MDVHPIDLRSGAVTLDTRNPGAVTTWAATDDLVVKAAGSTAARSSSLAIPGKGEGER